MASGGFSWDGLDWVAGLRCSASGCRPLPMYLLRLHDSGSVGNLANRSSLLRALRRLIGGDAPAPPEQMTTPLRLLPRLARFRAVDPYTRLKEVEQTMQTLVPKHELDQLATAVERTPNAAAECVHQVSVRDLTQTDVVAMAERMLYWLSDVTKALRLLRGPGDEPSLITNLKKLEGAAKYVRNEVDLIAHAKKTITDKDVLRAVDECVADARGLTETVERILALDEVRGVRLGLRAKAANDSAQAIVADLRAP